MVGAAIKVVAPLQGFGLCKMHMAVPAFDHVDGRVVICSL